MARASRLKPSSGGGICVALGHWPHRILGTWHSDTGSQWSHAALLSCRSTFRQMRERIPPTGICMHLSSSATCCGQARFWSLIDNRHSRLRWSRCAVDEREMQREMQRGRYRGRRRGRCRGGDTEGDAAGDAAGDADGLRFAQRWARGVAR